MNKKHKVTIEQIERAYITKGALVLRRCRMILRNENDADDMLHETFRRILKYNIQLENSDIPLSFLYRTAQRCCFDLLRQHKRTKAQISDDEVEEIADSFTCETYELSELLNKYFYSLDKKMQTVALMYYVDGLTQEQIATELGWSRKTIGKKLNQLRIKAEKLKNE